MKNTKWNEINIHFFVLVTFCFVFFFSFCFIFYLFISLRTVRTHFMRTRYYYCYYLFIFFLFFIFRSTREAKRNESNRIMHVMYGLTLSQNKMCHSVDNCLRHTNDDDKLIHFQTKIEINEWRQKIYIFFFSSFFQ